MKILPVIGCLYLLLLAGCVKNTPKDIGEVTGFVPIYVPESVAKSVVFSTTPKATVHAGKILVLGNRLFQVETGEGVHVINITNPASPAKLGFINIPGCSEVSAKGNELYANNYNDLVVITGIGTYNPAISPVLKRVADAFPAALNAYPTGRNIYFECPDPEKGFIAGWQTATIKNPKCRR